jgi:hypothetical protein
VASLAASTSACTQLRLNVATLLVRMAGAGTGTGVGSAGTGSAG